MKLSAWSKRLLAGVCTAALLAGGASALALSPAALPAPEALSVTNASDAQLRAALSKLAVVYSSDARGWQVSSPYEDASLSSASCGLYPYLFLSQDDATVSLTLGMSCFSTQKMELQSIRVETKDSTYNFTCDDQYDGGYDADLKSWFDFEFFAMDDHAEYLTEWAARGEKVVLVRLETSPAGFRRLHCPERAEQPGKVIFPAAAKRPRRLNRGRFFAFIPWQLPP